MSIAGRRVPLSAVVLLGLIMMAGAIIPVLTSGERPGTREIRLVTRGMAFYLEEDPHTPNPAIEVNAGERVVVTLRNDDRGIAHDFAVPALAAGLDSIGSGESARVTLSVPRTPGRYEYLCRPHRLMMRGTILVR